MCVALIAALCVTLGCGAPARKLPETPPVSAAVPVDWAPMQHDIEAARTDIAYLIDHVSGEVDYIAGAVDEIAAAERQEERLLSVVSAGEETAARVPILMQGNLSEVAQDELFRRVDLQTGRLQDTLNSIDALRGRLGALQEMVEKLYALQNFPPAVATEYATGGILGALGALVGFLVGRRKKG